MKIRQAVEIDPCGKYAIELDGNVSQDKMESFKKTIDFFWQDPNQRFLIVCGVRIQKVS